MSKSVLYIYYYYIYIIVLYVLLYRSLFLTRLPYRLRPSIKLKSEEAIIFSGWGRGAILDSL